jgi:hypothetical protein
LTSGVQNRSDRRSDSKVEAGTQLACEIPKPSQSTMPHLTTRGSWQRLGLLLILALALRLAAGWAWQARLEGRFGMGDSESYWSLGLAIAQGRPYECGPEHAQVFRTPGYPILLAPILWLAGDGQTAVLLARAEAALLGTLAVLAVWWLARLLFDDRAAMVAAVLAAFYPEAIAQSALILSEATFCPLMLLQLAIWTIAWNSATWQRRTIFGFCGGLAAGAATLMRPSWLLFTPLAAVVGIVVGSRGEGSQTERGGSTTAAPTGETQTRRTSSPAKQCCTIRTHDFCIATCMILGLIVAMLPWWIRNLNLTGRFVPTTLQVGASLYDGLNPNATGASNMDFVPRFLAEEQERPDRPTSQSVELGLDHRLRAEAMAWAWANPGRAVQLTGIKFLRMWNIWPNEPRLSSWPLRLAVLFTYTPLLFFAIIGALRTFRRGWPYILCWLPAAYLTLLHVVFVSSIRYREPAMLAVLALAAGAIGMRDWGFGIRSRNKPN